MTDRVLHHIGENAVLRGTLPCLAIIERGVTVHYAVGQEKFYQSEYASVVDVASIAAGLAPEEGDSLEVTFSDGSTSSNVTYALGAVISNNGDLIRFSLLPQV